MSTGADDDASDALGLLIGRKGETLTALQYLLNVMVSSRYEGQNVFAVDIDGYRRRREQRPRRAGASHRQRGALHRRCDYA